MLIKVKWDFSGFQVRWRRPKAKDKKLFSVCRADICLQLVRTAEPKGLPQALTSKPDPQIYATSIEGNIQKEGILFRRAHHPDAWEKSGKDAKLSVVPRTRQTALNAL